jgi:hypothetical protein
MTFLGVLGTVGAVAGWTLLGVLLLALAALAVPFDALYDSARSAHPFRVTWLWGAVCLYPGAESRRAKRAERKKKKTKSRRAKPPNPARRRGMIALARDPGFRTSLLADLLRLLRRIEVPLLDLRIALGLTDPADTGLLYGLLSAAIGAATADPRGVIGGDGRHRVSAEPVFDEEILALTGRANLRVVPVAIVGTALRVALGPTGRRVIAILWRTRR